MIEDLQHFGKDQIGLLSGRRRGDFGPAEKSLYVLFQVHELLVQDGKHGVHDVVQRQQDLFFNPPLVPLVVNSIILQL